LDSIFSQTYRDFEVIALDDASTDNSVEILREYETNGKIRLVVNERNSGTPFAQWKRGLTMAKGEYTWIAESDDYASPYLLEKLVAAMAANPQVGLVYAQSMMVDEVGHQLGKYNYVPKRLNPKRWESDFVNDGKDEVACFLFVTCVIPNASAVLSKTSLMIAASERADKMRLTGDWWTYVEILMRADVAFVAEPLNFFRMHSGSVRSTTKRFAVCAEFLRVRAHICSKVNVKASERRKAIKHEFGSVWAYLDSAAASTDPEWLSKVMIDAKAIHWSAVPRLGYLKFKRQAKRIPFFAEFVRWCRGGKRIKQA
jgi:glycosyltransferase involved in cell wall biosynthesis